MQNIFSESGLSVAFYIGISATFILTMISFLDQKAYTNYKWIHHMNASIFTFWCILALAFEPRPTKMYAILTLLSLIIVEVAIRRKRRSRLP